MSKAPRIAFVPLYKLVPNIITIMGLCLGISAVRYALDYKFTIAAALILIAALADGIDGRIARLLNCSSNFGAQLDSFADLISFGVAPAVVMYLWSLCDIPYKGIGWSVVLFYITCSALRLARFNSQLDDEEAMEKGRNFFAGLPMPAAAGMNLLPLILTFEIINYQFSYWLIAAYMIFIGFMMVSSIPTFSAKKIAIKREYVPMLLLFIGLLIASAILEPWVVLPFIGIIYLISIPFSVIQYHRTYNTKSRFK